MNDPHVVALVYRIEHGDSFEYCENAAPLCLEEDTFSLSVKDKEVRFELRNHYSEIEEADEALKKYIHVWEFDVQLKKGPDSFRLVLDRSKSEIIDREPTPGHAEIRDHGGGSDSVRTKLIFGEYPAPPSDLAINDDIEMMHYRYMRYKSGREPLPGVAYFCLSMVEDPPKTTSGRIMTKRRKAAAKKFDIDPPVLAEIGHLSSTRGGRANARKLEGADRELSPEEHSFLDEAIRAVIRRTAEKEHSPEVDYPCISCQNLPPLKG